MKTKKIAAAGFTALVLIFASCKNPMINVVTNESENSNTENQNPVTEQEPVTPEVTVNASSAVYKVGSKATLTATATVSDGGVLSYQWYSGSDAISAATSSSYISEESSAGTYTYSVKVTNTLNGKTASKTSDSVTITVEEAPEADAETPVISAQPQSASYDIHTDSSAAALSVTATVSDGGTLLYQWYCNEIAIDGATSASYTPSISATGTFNYKVVVTNTFNAKTASVTSAVAIITVTDSTKVNALSPVFATDLTETTVTYTEGDTVSDVLIVAATSSDGGTITYQWYKNGNVIDDATSASYTPDAETAGTFTYNVHAFNTITDNGDGGNKTASATSKTVTVVVNPLSAEKPVISASPAGASYSQGDTATAISVTASVPVGGTLSYQWYSNTASASSGGTVVSGATSASYTPSTENAGTTYYYCVVTNTVTNGTKSAAATCASSCAQIVVSEATEGTGGISIDFN